MFFALFVVGRLTPLGDNGRYLAATAVRAFGMHGLRIFTDGTYFIEFFAGMINQISLGQTLVTNAVFNLLAFFGVKKIIDEIKIEKKNRYTIFLLLLFMPSYNLWSSFASKEALMIFAVGIIMSRLIQYFDDKKFKIDILLFLALYLVFLFKKQYLIAIFELIVYIKVMENFKLNKYLELLIILLLIFLNFLVLYIFRDYIDLFSRLLYTFFRIDAGSTRENPFVEKYDIFKKAPYGVFLAFWGPTVEEMKSSLLHKLSFFESLVIILLFVVLLKDSLFNFLIKMNFHYRRLFIVFNTSFWLLFVHYPQGMFNPGSAIRYRTNFFLVIVILLYYISVVRRREEKGIATI